MYYVYRGVGISVSLLWSIVSSVLSIIPVGLIGGIYGLQLLSGNASLDNWMVVTAILVFVYVTFTELGCWLVELLNNTIVDEYLSKVAYRLVTAVGVVIVVGGMYIASVVLGGLL